MTYQSACLQTSVTIIADEDVAVNKLVAHVRAVDSDDPSTDNGRLSYFLHGDGSDKFLLSTDNGMCLLRSVNYPDRTI